MKSSDGFLHPKNKYVGPTLLEEFSNINLSWRKPRKGATPVPLTKYNAIVWNLPAPTKITGTEGSFGSLKNAGPFLH